MSGRFAGTVLYALLAGQMAFGVAAIAALAMKGDPSPRIVAEAATLVAAAEAGAVVR